MLAISMIAMVCAAILLLYPHGSAPTASPALVEPPIEANVQALADRLGCPESLDALVCLVDLSVDVYEAKGVAQFVATIKDWQEEVLPNGLPCHRMTHGAGRRALDVATLEKVREDVLATSGLCANGFFHGAVEGMSTLADGTGLSELLYSFCANLPDLINDCTHSAGHTMAMESPRDVYGALRLCDVFGSDAIKCAAGVFMSYGRGVPGFDDAAEVRTIGYSPSDAQSVCRTVAEEYQTICWFQLWIAFQGDPALGGIDAYYTACPDPIPGSVIAQPDSVRFCYRGLGMLHLRKATIPAPEAAEKCPSDVTERYWCSFGIGWAMMYEYVTMFSSTEGFVSDCPKFEKSYQTACRDGEAYALIPGNGL